jgi:aspartyl aminopeptidase
MVGGYGIRGLIGYELGDGIDGRDLSLAGRVIVSSPSSKTLTHQLVRIDKPLLRIPTLAIHLDRTQNDSFKFNRETEFRPIAGLVEDALNTPPATPMSTTDDAPIQVRHHSALLTMLSEAISQPINTIKDFELVLYDTQPPTLGGFNDEFIFSPRLDNLEMTFCAIKSLQQSTGLESDDCIRMISLFDHEVPSYLSCRLTQEIGSLTAHGADSNFLPTVLTRLCALPGGSPTAYEETLSKSFLISADMAHAVNPNFDTKYEDQHKPKLNHGVVVKVFTPWGVD